MLPTLIVGTVAFSAALVATVYFAPAAMVQRAVYGAAGGFVIDVGFQVAANIDAGERPVPKLDRSDDGAS